MAVIVPSKVGEWEVRKRGVKEIGSGDGDLHHAVDGYPRPYVLRTITMSLFQSPILPVKLICSRRIGFPSLIFKRREYLFKIQLRKISGSAMKHGLPSFR
jgi:hypothetical protein